MAAGQRCVVMARIRIRVDAVRALTTVALPAGIIEDATSANVRASLPASRVVRRARGESSSHRPPTNRSEMQRDQRPTIEHWQHRLEPEHPVAVIGMVERTETGMRLVGTAERPLAI